MIPARLWTTLSAPVWLAQAARVALATERLPEASGPRSGRIGAGRLRLLILGDSSAAGVGAATQDQALAGQLAAALADLEPAWTLHARTGATTAQTLTRLRNLPPEPADAAIIALGVNDVTRAVPLARWQQNQRELARLLHQRFGVRHLYLTGVPPMGDFPALPHPLRGILGARAARFDRALAELAPSLPGARHMQMDAAALNPALMARDGYHPGPGIYAAWADTLARQIRVDLAAAPPAPTGAPR